MQKLDITVKKDSTRPDVGMVFISGDISLANIDSLKSKLIEIINEYQHIHISITHVTAIDLAFIQLLYSLKGTFASLGRAASVDIDLPAGLESLLITAGFKSLIAKVTDN